MQHSLFPNHSVVTQFDAVLDIESSGLQPRGYPIEIAWVHPVRQQWDSFLIQPAPRWTHWCLHAENQHGIERDELEHGGICVKTAARRLNERLAGQTVVCDGFAYDRFWLHRLYEAAEMECSFVLAPMPMLPVPQDNVHRALGDAHALYQAWLAQHQTLPIIQP